MAPRVEVTSRELQYGIEAATLDPSSVSEALQRVKEGQEGFLASAAIITAAARTFSLEGYSDEEILEVLQRGLVELGVEVVSE